MSHLTSKFEVETGNKAMYRSGGADYHTLRYVNWLEDLVENLNDRITKQGSEPSEICPKCLGRGSCDKSRNGNLEYGTCDKCGGSGKLLPC